MPFDCSIAGSRTGSCMRRGRYRGQHAGLSGGIGRAVVRQPLDFHRQAARQPEAKRRSTLSIIRHLRHRPNITHLAAARVHAFGRVGRNLAGDEGRQLGGTGIAEHAECCQPPPLEHLRRQQPLPTCNLKDHRLGRRCPREQPAFARDHRRRRSTRPNTLTCDEDIDLALPLKTTLTTRRPHRTGTFSGTIYVFRCERADRVKLLVWDGSGLVLLWNRLESGVLQHRTTKCS